MASSTDFLLALESVTVSFDGFKAVDDLNLYIDYGELRVIIGPNGAGKTTVLDLICGRTRVGGGSIKFKDQEITGCKERAASAANFRRRPSMKTSACSRISNCRCRAAATWPARCSGNAPMR
jgi:urea transport system ATP-binding protein